MPYTDWTSLAHTTQDYIPVANVVGAMASADLSDTTNVANGDALIGVKSPLTGSVARTQHQKNSDFVNVADFGADPAASSAVNTTAFNAAIATSNCVDIPDGTFNLNALTNYTGSSLHLRGRGRGTKLVFNTTGDGITATLSGGSAQSRTLHIEGISFGNSINTPSSFIKIGFSVDALIERCYFSDTSATYCIDNVSGYGLQIENCVFSDITGGGYVHRASAGSNLGIRGCDFTRIGTSAIRFENTDASPAGTVIISNTVIESCSGDGIQFNKGVGGGFAWNVFIVGCHFELNTGFDITINPNGSAIQSYLNITSCVFNGTPTVDLGNNGRIQINSCANGGGNICVVSGSSSAQARLYNSSGFSKSGVFVWFDDVATLTSGRVPFATTGGVLNDAAGFTFNGADLFVPGAIACGVDASINYLNGATHFVKGLNFCTARLAGGANELIQIGAGNSGVTTTSIGQGAISSAFGSYAAFTSTGITTFYCGVSNSAAVVISAAGSLQSILPTAGIGYGAGAGGTVTQATSRTTGVTLNTVTGAITLVSAAGSTTPASFTVTNSAVAATDFIGLNQVSGTDKYILLVTAVAAGSFQITAYTTGGTTTEQPVIKFQVFKGVSA